jgi:hypothetical protein
VKQGGALRVIDKAKGQTCKDSERRLVWNQRGPRGLAGSAGSPGATGPAGPAGPAGPSGPVALNYVASDTLVAPAGEQVGGEVDCPNGQSVTGGGVGVLSSDPAVSINSSNPFDNDSDADNILNNGWRADVNNPTAEATLFSVYAICTPASSVH